MLVSCIMPTFNRRKFIPIAVRSFLSQNWPDKELVILDNGDDGTEELVPVHESVHYARLSGERRRIGTMRNACIAMCRGEIIVHFDSDDWSAPGRISDQVNRLIESGKSVSGYHSMLFWNQETQQASKYSGTADYSLGSALCYRKSFWEKTRFVDTSVGEDNTFVGAARPNEIISVDAGRMMVARIHAENTSAKTGPLSWPAVSVDEIPRDYFEGIRA